MKKHLQKLDDIEKELTLLGQSLALLYWDQHTIMPEQATEERGEQISYAVVTAHNQPSRSVSAVACSFL